MTDAEMQTLVAQLVPAVVAALKGPPQDLWAKTNAVAAVGEAADMAAARAHATAEIEAHNARVIEEQRWANMPAAELATLEAGAKARRYAEALADLMDRDDDVAKAAPLAEGLPKADVTAALTAVASEVTDEAVAERLRAIKVP